MRGDSAFLNAVDRLYGAALQPELWNDALTCLADLARANHIVVVETSPAGAALSYARADERDVLQSLAAQQWCDPGPLINSPRPGVVWTRSSVQPDREFRRSTYYNEVVRPLNGFYSMQVGQRTANASFFTTLCRTPRDDDFDRPALALLERLTPHLANAIELRLRFGVLDAHYRSLAEMLDRANGALVMTDASARPIFANRAAEMLISAGTGVRLQGGRLAASTAHGTQQLRRAIATVAQMPLAQPSTKLRLTRAGRPPLLVSITSIRSVGMWSPRVAVFVADPTIDTPIDRGALALAFRLTDREAEVGILLAGGLDPRAIAETLGLHLSTVRSHLKHAFEKTGTNNQVAFTALIRAFALPFH